jgi:RHS repeat-associated protein
MTTARTYDFLNRLQNISSTPSASGESALAYNYAYNDANQRVRVNLADGSFWIYEYDKLGQVISGKRYWSDWTPVAGQQYEYAFDDIGNRSSTKSGGDQVGAALRAASYTANALNQYTSRDVPAYLNVLGIAHANASVTVNGQSPYRRGEYYRSEINSDNSANSVWQSVTNIASLSGTSQTNTGNLFLPKTAESYTFDADGNLTSDGRWTNKWDGENRLIDTTSHSSGPSGSRKSLQFAYDALGRRYSKVVSNWTGSAWTRALHELYLNDGWNLLGALDGTNNAIVRSFLWGLDLSGSLQGAGGVGGLLFFTHHSTSPPSTHCAAYDGNGNVMALVDGKTGSTSARYEYDPFGQTIRASGTMAMLNPVRFSSKHADDETDLAYYGYRYLNPNAGRWLSRDPIAERGGLNLYGFIRNNQQNEIDSLGLASYVLRRVGAGSSYDSGWDDVYVAGNDMNAANTVFVRARARSYKCWGLFPDGDIDISFAIGFSCSADGKITATLPAGRSESRTDRSASASAYITVTGGDGTQRRASVAYGASASSRSKSVSFSLSGAWECAEE